MTAALKSLQVGLFAQNSHHYYFSYTSYSLVYRARSDFGIGMEKDILASRHSQHCKQQENRKMTYKLQEHNQRKGSPPISERAKGVHAGAFQSHYNNSY